MGIPHYQQINPFVNQQVTNSSHSLT